MKVLGADCGTTIITKSDNWSDHQAKTGLVDLKLGRILTLPIHRNHATSNILSSQLWEVNVECEEGGVELGRELPRSDDQFTKILASGCAITSVIQEGADEISECLGVEIEGDLAEFIVRSVLGDLGNSLVYLLNTALASLISKALKALVV